MKLHVIIPVYNAKSFLQAAVDSVLGQPWQEIGIVLVDDGSCDGSDALCDALAAENSRISVIHQANAGVSAARNTGIEAVLETAEDTDYIAFLDADDFWVPGALSKTVPDVSDLADILAFGTIACTENVCRYTYPSSYTPHVQDGGNASIWSLLGHFGANLYQAQLLRKWRIRFIPGLRYSEDQIFRMQCIFLSDQIRFHREPLYIYRHNSSSAMSKLKQIPVIENYTQIISAWIQSDLYLNAFEAETGRHASAGFVLAGIYFMDTASDHYKRFGRRKDLDAFYKSHPYYRLLKEMNPRSVSPKQFKNCQLLLHHPRLFQMKYNLLGVLRVAAHCILSVPFIGRVYDVKKYPLTELPPIT